MIYDYDDDFVVNSIDDEVLEAEEIKAFEEINTIGVSSDAFKEKMIKSSVYMALALMQLESEGMQEKYDGYALEYKRIYNIATASSPSNVSTIQLGRG